MTPRATPLITTCDRRIAAHRFSGGQGDRPATPDFDIVAVAEKFTIPSLELFTYGLFTNSDYLDAFVAHQQRHPAAAG